MINDWLHAYCFLTSTYFNVEVEQNNSSCISYVLFWMLDTVLKRGILKTLRYYLFYHFRKIKNVIPKNWKSKDKYFIVNCWKI